MKIKSLLFLLLIFIFSCSGSNYNFSEVTIKGGSLPEYNRNIEDAAVGACLLYTSPSPRDRG